MKDIKTVAFIVRKPADISECTRTGAGLAVENMVVALFIINAPMTMGDGEKDFNEQLEMIEDLEGAVFSNLKSNVDRFEYITYLSLEDMGTALKKYDLVVVF